MTKLVVNTTSTSEWLSLVRDATKHCNTNLTEDIESYLVFLLMRFIGNKELAKKVVALDYLESQLKVGKQQQELKRDVGDSCLLFSGLFPGRAQARKVRISYYVNVGKSAYHSLGDIEHDRTGQTIYYELRDNFVNLIDIMHSMREVNGSQQALDLIQSYELWEDTQSKTSKERIVKSLSSADSAFFNPINKNLKH